MRRKATLLGIVAGLLAVFAAISPAAQASTPNTGYEQFKGCPDPFVENPEVATCMRTEIVGGNFKMGSKNVTIEQPMELSGGLTKNLTNFFYTSQGGLSEAKQKVPGGVIGITGLVWLAEFLGTEALTLYAITELAGTPTFASLKDATLPIKVRLTNTTGVLGPNCHVGSNSKPITLHLINGTTSPPPPNEPITGKVPKETFDPVLEILHQTEGIFVDNAFSAPGASGCVLTLFGFIPISLDGLVNIQAGLPSEAGHNETKQNYNLEATNAEFVYE